MDQRLALIAHLLGYGPPPLPPGGTNWINRNPNMLPLPTFDNPPAAKVIGPDAHARATLPAGAGSRPKIAKTIGPKKQLLARRDDPDAL
jgi:hypothetical protein